MNKPPPPPPPKRPPPPPLAARTKAAPGPAKAAPSPAKEAPSPAKEAPARRRFAPPPVPVPEQAQERSELAEAAILLRDEQLRARVVYVNPAVETNAELDAITAKVVDELKAMQAAAQNAHKIPVDPHQLEAELIRTLRELLEKMVSVRREAFMRHKIESSQRRIIGLFLNADSFAESDAFETVHAHPDEALFAAYRRHNEAIRADLRRFKYTSPDVQEQALARLHVFHKKLAADVMARTKPELERLLGVYRDVLLVFLMRDFREALGEFAWEVIRESRAAHGHRLDYKITEAQFGRFREVFEARFMDRLLASIQKPLAAALGETSEHVWREETVRFAADPRIYAEVCGVMCNAVYNYLHGEGFLDLPVDWQETVAPG